MSWFNKPSKINERIELAEGESRAWQLSFKQSTNVSLEYQLIDGWGPYVRLIPDDEWGNYKQGLAYQHMVGLAFENAGYFFNKVRLPRGAYYLVVFLPHIQDGNNTYSEFNLRYEPLE